MDGIGAEDGIDLNGLTKEFLYFAAEEFNNENSVNNENLARWKRIFASVKEKLCGFPVPRADPKFYLFYGRLIGITLFTGFQAPFPVNPILLKAACGTPLSGGDADELSANYFDSRVKPTLTLNAEDFGICFDRAIGREIYPLKENGENIDVTEDNKVEYLELLTKNILGANSKSAIQSFAQGLRDVIPEELFKFTYTELDQMIHGTSLNLSDLQAHTVIKCSKENITSAEQNSMKRVLGWLWEVLEASSESEQSEFLHFITGSKLVPIGGAKDLSPKFNVTFELNRASDYLPEAHVCFNQLVLPIYTSKNLLQQKLQDAVMVRSFGLQ